MRTHNSNPPSLRSLRLAVLFSSIVGALVCPALAIAFPQAAASHKLTLIQPRDAEFDQLLRDNFPGFDGLDGYAVFRPFLAILRNDTQQAATAYVVAWDVHSPGMANAIRAEFVQRDRVAATAAAFRPGELRLLSGLFNLSPAEWKKREWAIAKFMPDWVSRPPYTSTNVVSVDASVDAAIFEDGGYTGRDQFRLLMRYQCIRQAERDVSESVLKLMDAKTPPEQIVATLSQDVEAGHAAGPATSRGDTNATCALYRGEEAENLLSEYRKSGEESMVVRAWSKVNRPKEIIRRLPQD